MADALIVFFLKKLEDQLRQEAELLSGFEEDIEWIKSELQAMVAFLRDVDRRQGRDENVRAWAGEVRSLVYDAEDIIDGFIRRIKNKVIEVKERRDRYGFHIIQEKAPGTTSIQSTSRGPSVSAATPFVQENDIMGIDDDVEQLTELTLEGRSHQRNVISVFVMGGLGKTTLVKEVYRRVKTRFDCYSWVSMFTQFDGWQLQERTYHYLQDKNYLLVLDDTWEAELWEGLKHALPRDRGSVIITTQIKDIASSIEDNCSVYELQPLSNELAWTFFCRKAFRNQGTCPGHLKEFVEDVVRRCEGLPLATFALAALSSCGEKPQEMQSVLCDLDGIFDDNHDVERLHKALLCSYNHLPFYLKYCFLHISLFPEDYEIGRMRLIRMWIAEGFVQKDHDVVKACKVHNLMREVATKMFKEEKHRRLSIYNNAENIPTSVGKLNICSFHLFIATKLSCSALRKLLAELRLVRILNLQRVCIESLPEEIGNLIHLRYLDLRGTMIKDLPKSFRNLRNLQTLDIRNTNVEVLPCGINMLQQLRHLLMASLLDRNNTDFVKMLKGRLCFKQLQTLSRIQSDEYFVKELRSLTNLRKLYIGIMTGACSKELCTSLGELKKLRSLTIISKHPFEDLQLNSLLKPPPHLEKLKLQVSISRLPHWFQYLNHLHTLYFPSTITSVLTLASSAFICSDVCCSPRGFTKLTSLRILDKHSWVRWMPIEEGTMPSLWYLLLANCPNLVQLPEGFHYPTALQSLTLSGMSEHFSHANGYWTY
ncbi:hypothetical protein ACOSQ2_013082 [Xanthoceras sorbifolium]